MRDEKEREEREGATLKTGTSGIPKCRNHGERPQILKENYK